MTFPRGPYFSTFSRMPPLSSSFLIDAFPGAVLAYSFRKLRQVYSGAAIRIRRSSDNTEHDVGFIGNDLDAGGAAAFLAGSSGFITTWYDQSVTATNVTQTTAANQPSYTASGINSLPCMTFDGSTSWMQTTASIDLASAPYSITTNFMHSMVLQVDSTGGNIQVDFMWPEGSSNPRLSSFVGSVSAKNIRVDFPNDTTGLASGTYSGTLVDNPLIWQSFRDGSNNQKAILDNVVAVNSSISLGFSAGTSARLGLGASDTIPTFPIKGLMSEFVIWNDGTLSDFGIRSNQNAYYGAY